MPRQSLDEIFKGVSAPETDLVNTPTTPTKPRRSLEEIFGQAPAQNPALPRTIPGKKSLQEIFAPLNEQDYNSEPSSQIEQPIQSTENQSTEKKSEEYNPSFPAKQGEGIGKTLLKQVGNLPKSGLNFVKGTIDFLNPINTVKSLKNLGSEINDTIQENKQGETHVGVADVLKEIPKTTYHTLVPSFVQHLISGDEEQARQALVNDPIGEIAPLVLLARGAAEKLGKGAQFDAAVSKTAKPVINAAEATGKVVGKIGDIGKKTVNFGVSQTTGLNPETIKTIANNPEAFSKEQMAGVDRGTIANKVKSAIDERLNNLSETGKEYQAIREAPNKVKLSENHVQTVLDKYGIKLDENGKILRTAESVPLKSGDVAALQDFIDQYGNLQEHTGNSFLNTRKALSNLSEFDATKSDVSNKIAKDLRAAYDADGKAQLTGLAELDAKYSPEVKLLKQIKTDYLKPDGTLKDGALNKIANLTGKGKDIAVDRLKQIVPGIEKDINILKAIEDIEVTKGQKVGTYMRGAVGGFAASGGNPFVAAISGIISQPSVAVPLIRAYGSISGAASSLVELAISKMAQGIKLSPQEGNIFKGALNYYKDKFVDIMNTPLEKLPEKLQGMPAGLSIEDVSKKPGFKQGAVSETVLLEEAKKYKTPEEFISSYKGSGTQYGEYNPSIRHGGTPGSKRLTELGVDPEKVITIYRGIDDITGKMPKKIQDGDFVTTDYESARAYTGNDKDVVKMKVKAKNLFADDPKEFMDEPFYKGSEYIYSSKDVQQTNLSRAQLIDIWNKANKK